MLDIRNVVIPYVFSPACRAAARRGIRLADHFSAQWKLLHVIPVALYGSPYEAGEDWPPTEEVQRKLENEVAALRLLDAGNPADRTAVLRGEPVQLIEEYVRETPGAFVVLPTHGFGAFRRLLLGSVASKLLHDLSCPMLTGAHLEAAPSSESQGYGRVLCAVDLREHSAAVLRWAADFAQSWGAALTVVNAVNIFQSGPVTAKDFPADLRERYIEDARREVAELIEKVGCKANVAIDLKPPEEQIPTVATETLADVLVVGRSLERGMVGRLREHSYSLVRSSPVPVISV